jgi:hypothetical protein
MLYQRRLSFLEELGWNPAYINILFEEKGGFGNDNMAIGGTAVAPKAFERTTGRTARPALGIVFLLA